MLEVADLRAGYGRLPVLHDITLRVGEGEFVAIVGPNGAGKSTLFKTISGTVAATAGQVRFQGKDLLLLLWGSPKNHAQLPESSLNHT